MNRSEAAFLRSRHQSSSWYTPFQTMQTPEQPTRRINRPPLHRRPVTRSVSSAHREVGCKRRLFDKTAPVTTESPRRAKHVKTAAELAKANKSDELDEADEDAVDAYESKEERAAVALPRATTSAPAPPSSPSYSPVSPAYSPASPTYSPSDASEHKAAEINDQVAMNDESLSLVLSPELLDDRPGEIVASLSCLTKAEAERINEEKARGLWQPCEVCHKKNNLFCEGSHHWAREVRKRMNEVDEYVLMAVYEHQSGSIGCFRLCGPV
jgi:hypothetical protein